MSPVFELMSQRSSAWAHDVIIKMAAESQVVITHFITLYLSGAGKERTIRENKVSRETRRAGAKKLAQLVSEAHCQKADYIRFTEAG
jgi:hypothetical protein